jgi:hypothetical protein
MEKENKSSNLIKRPTPEILSEYEKAQDSAEHHNNMIWTLTALGIVGSLIILHIFWTNRPNILYSILMLFMGALILFYFSYLVEGAHSKKIIKYKVCQEIERDYGFIGQNLRVEDKRIFTGGIKIFRTIIMLIFFLYAISTIFALGVADIGGEVNSVLIWTVILDLLAITLSLIMEIIYWIIN